MPTLLTNTGSPPPPTIALDAYLRTNLGDDLMVRAALDRFPDAVFLVTHGETRPFPPGRVRVVPVRDLASADAFLVLGGSMFMDVRGRDVRTWLRHRRLWTRRVVTAAVFRLKRRPVLVIGCNVGPLETAWGRLAVRTLFSLCSAVSVRDSLSWHFAERAGVRRLTCAPDLVLASPEVERAATTPRQPVLAVAPAAPAATRHPGYVDAMARRCVALVHEHGLTGVAVFAFHGDGEDHAALVELATVLRERGIACRTVEYHGDVDAVLQDFAACEVVLASRLHASILALALHRTVEVAWYSEKIVTALDELGAHVSMYPASEVPDDPGPAVPADDAAVRVASHDARAHLELAASALGYPAAASGSAGAPATPARAGAPAA